MKKIEIQAHRGVSNTCPENTLPAFERAIAESFAYIETDCKFTKDSVCVLLHDHTVNRTCRRAGGSPLDEQTKISSLTNDELQKLDAGIYMGDEFAGTHVPTLEEGLAFVKGKNIRIKLDNVFESFDERQFEIFCDIIEHADMGDQLAFACKTLPYLAYLAERFPDAEMNYDGIVTDEALEKAYKYAAGRLITWIPYDNGRAYWFAGEKANKNLCAKAKKYGRLGIWATATHDEVLYAVNEFDADAVESDGSIKPEHFV